MTGNHDSLKRLFWAALALTFLGPGLATALAALSGIGHRWIDLLALLALLAAPGLVSAALASAFLALCRRAEAWAGVGVMSLGLLAVWLQAYPHQAEVDPRAPTLTLYVANLYARNEDADAVLAAVREARPDVVILIETADGPAARLDEILAGLPHRRVTARQPWRGGGARTVIASRWPLSPLEEPPGVHMASTISRTPLGPIRFTAVHLTRPWPFQPQEGQIQQIEALAEFHDMVREPSVVAGDFNTTSTARIGSWLRERTGLIPAPAMPGTWPSPLPPALGVGIDHVWHTSDLVVVERRLGRPTGSDHRAVVTVLGRAARR